MIRRGGLFFSACVLGTALSALPNVVAAQPAPAPAAMVEVSASDINSWGFAASVPVGGTLTWTNTGAQSHTVTALDGSFDSGLVAPGADATLEFDTPGVYAYQCSPHPWMKGYIIVSPDNTSGGPGMAMVEGSASDINSWGFAYNIQAGQSVTWTNNGNQAHSATSTTGDFDTGLVAPGASGSAEFDTPGLYTYQCSPHPWMKGNVLVN
jgi:plastocyanin